MTKIKAEGAGSISPDFVNRVSTMKSKKINDTRLISLVDEGKSQAEIARRLGVSRQAVNKRLIELRGRTTKVVAAKKIEQVVDSKLDAVQQLQKSMTTPMRSLIW